MLQEHTGTSAAQNSEVHIPLPCVLRWYWALSLVAFGLMLLVSYLERRAGIPLGARGPFPDPLFGDLLEYLPNFKLIHTPGFYTAAGQHVIAYPPLGAALFGFLYAFGHPIGLYLSILAGWLLACVWGLTRALSAKGIRKGSAVLFFLTVVLTSFPIEGLIQRGNIELFVWIGVSIGLWAILCGRQDTAAICWGLAAGIKLYPVLLFVLFVRKRGFRGLLVACASLAVSAVAAMRFLVPDLALAFHRSSGGVAGYQRVRSSMWNLHEVAVNHSLFVWFKLFSGFSEDSAKVSQAYFICGGLLFLVAYFGRARRLPLLNQLLVVITFMVLLPPVSYFYTLTNLYAAWVALALLCVEAARRQAQVPGLRSTILLFLPVFASFTLFTFRKIYLFGGLIQSLGLVCILIAALQYPFALPSRAMEENPTRA